MTETVPKSIDDLSPDRTNRLWWLLFIMSKCGGEADASESKWNWINAFCSDFEDDTFNLAIDLGLLGCTHNTDSDQSTAWLTDAGKALVGYFDKPPSLPLFPNDTSIVIAEKILRPYLTTAAVFGITPSHNFRDNIDMLPSRLVADVAKTIKAVADEATCKERERCAQIAETGTKGFDLQEALAACDDRRVGEVSARVAIAAAIRKGQAA